MKSTYDKREAIPNMETLPLIKFKKSSSRITLKIPKKGVSAGKWKIEPMTDPVVS